MNMAMIFTEYSSCSRNWTKSQRVKMYTGFLLTEESRAKLLALFPPKYERVIAEHVTHTFGVPATATPPAMPESLAVVGYIDDMHGVEGLLVAVNGSINRPDGSLFHVTWSLAEGRKAFETNLSVRNAVLLPEAIPFEATPKTFTS
jgi:hypothetical protein